MKEEGAFGKWLFHGQRLDQDEGHGEARPWYLVLWLTGVDYFSTLGYQPGIALLAAGALSPLATALLVLVTLFGALPVYRQVAFRSYAGQGSIAMLETLLSGWKGKILVLILLGFAATDFVITMTLSAADASLHIVENPYLHHVLEGDGPRLILTIGLLALLTLVFLRGFVEAIGLATLVAIPYLLLNIVVLSVGLREIFHHPDLWSNWHSHLALRGDWTLLLIGSALIFPRLALGLSGFETGVSVMPLVKGNSENSSSSIPVGRIQSTKKLLTAAALIMSVMLLLSSLVTTLLISEEAYQIGGSASGRAIAYLAHLYLGPGFGTIYDISTILILWFAGASAMAGLLHLIPRYLPRYGLAPEWTSYGRPLVLVLFAINVAVTLIFDANVEAQAGAYATGVLALILSAAFAVALTLWREEGYKSLYFWVITSVFAFTFVDNVITRPDGVIIAGVFIVLIIFLSAVSRAWRSTELRVSKLAMEDQKSAELWKSMTGKKVHLVPMKTSTPEARAYKSAEIRRYYHISGPIAFVHVRQLDNRSEFISPLHVTVTPEGENYVIDVTRAIAIANSIAYLSESIDPISIFLGLTRKNLVTQSLRFLLWGEGETALLVYAILLRFWFLTPEEDVRPLIFLMSE
jgi:hypothetical protein